MNFTSVSGKIFVKGPVGRNPATSVETLKHFYNETLNILYVYIHTICKDFYDVSHKTSFAYLKIIP